VQSASLRTCPSCGTELPVHDGYLTWCHRCNWNVTAPPRDAPGGPLNRLYAAAGRQLGDRLARELLAARELEPRLTKAKLAAYVVAGLVYAFVLSLVLGAALLLAVAPTNPAAIVAAIVFLGTAFLMRPRLGKPPTKNLVGREEAPILYETIDAVAVALETRTVTVVRIDHRYNASFAVLGGRRRHVLTLGLPLLAALEGQERVELIAHELAHGRNGDSMRGLFVGSAVNGLVELYDLLEPDPWAGEGYSELAFVERIANVGLYLLSRPVRWLLLFELHLLLQDSQRAEYLADALAARVAGTKAAVSSQEKLLLDSSFEQIVREHAHPGVEGDVFDKIHGRLAAVPERERERRRRVARLEETRLDATHPPTGLRIRMLEERPLREPAVVLDVARSAAIDRELERFRTAFQERLVEDYRDLLYYG
jgi:Zn-dependent protease with chaperone function